MGGNQCVTCGRTEFTQQKLVKEIATWCMEHRALLTHRAERVSHTHTKKKKTSEKSVSYCFQSLLASQVGKGCPQFLSGAADPAAAWLSPDPLLFFFFFLLFFFSLEFCTFHVSICLLNLTAANYAHISSENSLSQDCVGLWGKEKMPSRSYFTLPKPVIKWHNFSMSEFQQQTKRCASPSRVLIYPCGNMR